MADRDILLTLLQEIENEMRRLALWESVSPPPSAYESQLPFFYDTMNFSQWLQWVFIARFRAIIAGNHPLPGACNVSVMAEEAVKGLDRPASYLIELLARFDAEFMPAG